MLNPSSAVFDQVSLLVPASTLKTHRFSVVCGLIVCLFTNLVHAQPIAIYGTEYNASGTTTRILQALNPTLSTGTVSVAIDVAGFSAANGRIVGAPTGTVISGASLNAASWDLATRRVFFRDALGAGPLYSWHEGDTFIRYVASATTLMAGGASNLADNGTIYNGGLWYMEDATDALYRYDLATGGVRRFAGISGGTARTYNFGDIAVSSAGLLYISANRTNNQNNVLDRIDISSVTATTGTPTGFTQIVEYGNGSDGTTNQIFFDQTGTNLYMVQSITGIWNERTWHQINTTNGSVGSTIWTSTLNFSDVTSGFLVVPEPTTYALFSISSLLILASRYYRMRSNAVVTGVGKNEGQDATAEADPCYSDFLATRPVPEPTA